MVRSKLPDSLRALGRERLPDFISLPAGEFRFRKVFKHDFFAVTALYQGPSGKVVLKVGRKADFLGLPCGWMGRLLARYEAGNYCRLEGLDAVPRFLGMWGRHGFAHAYAAGHPMAKGERVADEFFDRLREAIRAIHRRGMAYVDLEKPQNVIVGDDGMPYLVDLQIAWRASAHPAKPWWPRNLVLSFLQEADRYHLAKLQRRTRPDLMTPQQLEASYRKPWYISLHAWLTRPAARLRRRTLQRFDHDRRSGERGAVS